MTSSELTTILERLESLGPQRRLNGKRAQLFEIRDRLKALHSRGHSWRSIARELSTVGEKVTADLLRSVCRAKVKHRTAKVNQTDNATARQANIRSAAQPVSAATPSTKSDGGFGAKGLRL